MNLEKRDLDDQLAPKGLGFAQPRAPPSLLHTSGSQLFVPKERLIVAQQFTAGEMGNQHGLRPVGTPECGILSILRHGFYRPFGTNKRISRFLTQR